ncbi:hypothetical protein Hanom_Chr00s000002g01599151 [Helianthus anomalus]
MDRYSLVAMSANSSISARHSGLGEIGGCIPCSSVAAVNRCSVQKTQIPLPKRLFDNLTLNSDPKQTMDCVRWLRQYSQMSWTATSANGQRYYVDTYLGPSKTPAYLVSCVTSAANLGS